MRAINEPQIARNSTPGNYGILSRTITDSAENRMEEKQSYSIVSGSQRLRDLQELHKQLNKSSYEPDGKSLGVVTFF